VTQLSSAAKDEKRADPLDDLAARDDRMLGMLFRLHERVAQIEARGGMDGKPEITPGLSIKQAAHVSGFSESAIRKLARQGKIGHTWIGRRLFVDAQTLPARWQCT
jgi:hypothetical protein